MPVSLPLLFSGGSGAAEVPTLALSEESPRIIKRFGPSNLIVDQVPDFINRDHETFRKFIEAYYEWLEQIQNPFGVIDSFSENMDIDQTIGLFLVDFREMYLKDFPYQLAVDVDGNVVSEANFLKNARSFYGAKGTEKAFRFLFRLIYNVTSEVAYPGKNILKCSHGKWIERKSIKTTSAGGTGNYAIEGSQVYQIDPVNGNVTASAVASHVIQYDRNYYTVTEIFIRDLVGEFDRNLPLKCDLSTGTISETIYPVITSIEVIDGGSLYQKHDDVGITTADEGLGASAVINGVNRDGKVLEIGILDSGVGYTKNAQASITSNTGDGLVVLKPVIGAVTNYAGFYENNDGKLSSNKKLFDADYYQDFSYVLRSEIHLDEYKELYKKLVHPAGFKMFGEVLLSRKLVESLPFHSEMQRYENAYIGHYTPYRMGTTADLYTVYPAGFNPRGDTYSTYQNYGQTGGKLFVKPVGFTFLASSTWLTIGATGVCGDGITASVFEFRSLNSGGTYGVLLLKTIDFNTASAGVTGAGFLEGATFRMYSDSGVYNAVIDRVRFGTGIVPETGGYTHDAQGKPLGKTLSVEGYIEAQGFSYDYWRVHHHPNIWGIRGLTGVWNTGTGAGASFGAMALNPFFRLPVGYHFHSDPYGTSYVGTTGDGNEYGLIESNQLTSPNF